MHVCIICKHCHLSYVRCEVFRAMFSSPTTSDDNAPLILSDVKPIVFMAVLEFIYTNSCNLTTDIVCAINSHCPLYYELWLYVTFMHIVRV